METDLEVWCSWTQWMSESRWSQSDNIQQSDHGEFIGHIKNFRQFLEWWDTFAGWKLY